MKLDEFERAMAAIPEPKEAMMRMNRRVPLYDLIQLQLQRRLHLAAQPNKDEEKLAATIEVFIGLVVFGIACLGALVAWWYRSS